MQGKADDLMSRLDLNLFLLSDGDSEIKSPIGRYGKDHWDVPMHALVVHHISPQTGPQKRAGHEPIYDSAKDMRRDAGGKGVGGCGPAR